MSENNKRNRDQAFTEDLESYVTENHPGIVEHRDEEEYDEEEYDFDEEEDELGDRDCYTYFQENPDFDLLEYLKYKYPLFAGREEEYLDIQEQWLRIRQEGNKTPKRYKTEQRIIHHLYETYDTSLYNTRVIERFVKYYDSNPHIFEYSIDTTLLKSQLEELKSNLAVMKTNLDLLLSEEEQYEEYTQDVEQAKDVLNNITDSIIFVLGEYQYTLIQPVLDKIREGVKINLSIPPIEIDTPTSPEHILILSVTTHGCHNTGNEYPTLLTIPDNIEICKTTLALPGEKLFSLGEHRGFLRNRFGETLYTNNIIQCVLQYDFTSSFTTINDFMRYPILMEINNNNNCIDTSNRRLESSLEENLKQHYKKWCDGVLNSTNKLTFHTRDGKYVKNKRFSLNGKESRNIVEYGITVLYDSSGLFPTGHQLIDVESTFQREEDWANITLQELMNELNSLNIWNKYGIIDSSCETGNLCLTPAVREYKSIGLTTVRGGRRLKKTRYTKRKKCTKKRNYPKNKCTKRKKYTKK